MHWTTQLKFFFCLVERYLLDSSIQLINLSSCVQNVNRVVHTLWIARRVNHSIVNNQSFIGVVALSGVGHLQGKAHENHKENYESSVGTDLGSSMVLLRPFKEIEKEIIDKTPKGWWLRKFWNILCQFDQLTMSHQYHHHFRYDSSTLCQAFFIANGVTTKEGDG